MKKKMVVLLMLILSVSTAVLHGTCEEIQTIIAVVTTKKGPLKIRQEPSRNARELDEIARGTYVTILESGEEMCIRDRAHPARGSCSRYNPIRGQTGRRIPPARFRFRPA